MDVNRWGTQVVLADAGFASGEAVAALEARKIEPLVAIARAQPHRPYDFHRPNQSPSGASPNPRASP